ncbi:hypothetical protein K488DRAFT_61299, partial [Vararia minispora EC-137]
MHTTLPAADPTEPAATTERDGLWERYVDERAFLDKDLADSWNAKTNGITIFASLFSAILATFVVDSYKNLQPNSSDTTVSALTHISQQLAAGADPSSNPGAFSSPDPTFRAPTSAVVVNALWFISLVLAISTAIGAVVLQQCTQKYLTKQS